MPMKIKLSLASLVFFLGSACSGDFKNMRIFGRDKGHDGNDDQFALNDGPARTKIPVKQIFVNRNYYHLNADSATAWGVSTSTNVERNLYWDYSTSLSISGDIYQYANHDEALTRNQFAKMVEWTANKLGITPDALLKKAVTDGRLLQFPVQTFNSTTGN